MSTEQTNKILWIDDSPDAMRHMLPSMFSKLWGKKLRSEIAIFGDAHMYLSNCDHDVISIKTEELRKAVYQEFVSFLIAMPDMSDDLVKDYLPMVNENSVNDLDKFLENPMSDIVNLHNDLYTDVYREYNQIQIQNFETIGEKIFKKLNMADYKYIMIDLLLTLKDKTFYESVYDISKPENKEIIENSNEKESDKKGIEKKDDSTKPLMAMIIYDYISKSNEAGMPQAFLYTTFSEPINFVEKWKELYEKKYGEIDEIEIYNRDGIGIFNKKNILIENLQNNSD